MIVTKVVLILSLVLGSFFLAEVQGFKQPKCRGKDTKLTPEELKVMTECLKEFSPNSKGLHDMAKDTGGCVGKCILSKQGLIDPTGTPVKDNIFKMVNASFEPDVAKEADELLGKCVDEKTTGIDKSEKACQTYWPFVECVAGAFMKVCADKGTAGTEAPKKS